MTTVISKSKLVAILTGTGPEDTIIARNMGPKGYAMYSVCGVEREDGSGRCFNVTARRVLGGGRLGERETFFMRVVEFV